MGSGGGEATTPDSPSIGNQMAGKLAVCLLFDPISWSAKDTDQTILEIKRHNQKIVRYCGK
jgi:hypothetical protein